MRIGRDVDFYYALRVQRSLLRSPTLPLWLLFVILQQIALIYYGGLAEYGVPLSRIFAFAAVAYWMWFCLILVRRNRPITQVDEFLIRWGYLVLCLLAVFISAVILNLKE